MAFSVRHAITILIDDDELGMGKMLTDVGVRMGIEPTAGEQTEVTFTFFHRPKNLMGRILNPLIRSDRRCTRSVPSGRFVNG